MGQKLAALGFAGSCVIAVTANPAMAQQSGGMLYAVFIAPDSDFSKLQSTYDKMLKSWQVK